MEYTPRMLDAALTARSAAAAGMVLLKNVQNALPLTAEDGEALPGRRVRLRPDLHALL